MGSLRGVVGIAVLCVAACAGAQTGAQTGAAVWTANSSTSQCGSIATRVADLSQPADAQDKMYPGIQSEFDFSCLPGAMKAAMYTRVMKSAGPGTYVSGVWSGDHMFFDKGVFDRRAISHVSSGVFDFNSIGDKAMLYWYGHFFGGMVAYNDEGIEPLILQALQEGYSQATVRTMTPGSDGTLDLVTGTTACLPSGGWGCTARAGGAMFDDGGYLFDESRPQTEGMTVASSRGAQVLHGMVLEVDGGRLKVSSAWGYANAGMCTHNEPGGGAQQVYGSVTCSLRMDGRPVSPGSFVAGVPACAVGSFEEEVQVTAVGEPSGGVQAVTFRARYPWFLYGNTILMMQGGMCGTLAVQDGKWPMGWPVVGAFTPTEMVFANCHNGVCSGGSTGVIPRAAQENSFQAHGSLTRAGSVVTFTSAGYPYPGTYSYPVGARVVVSGWSPEDLNGTYTVTANTMDAYDIRIQWKQVGGDESSAGRAGEIGEEQPALMLYPEAEIIGTDGGQLGHARLATNHMAAMGMVEGDTVIGAPTTEYQSNGISYVTAQTTPNDGSTSSDGINVADDGASPVGALLRMTNAGTTPGYSVMQAAGSWENYFALRNRPANNGYILHVLGGEPVSPNAKPYYLFADSRTYASLSVHPGDSSIHSQYTFVVDGGEFRVSPLRGAAGSVVTVGKDGVLTAEAATHLSVAGLVTAGEMVGGGAKPAMDAGAGVRCVVDTGANMAGVISCTTGAAGVVNRTVATVRFAGGVAVAPQGCSLMARNASAAGVGVYTTAPSKTGWTIAVGDAGLKAGTVYRWSYACL
jgi:hypothetical protein